MNYYKRHIGDYAAKAGHLSMLEHGAYGLLMDAYYNREEGPTRAEAIRLARARAVDEVAAVDAVLAEFFIETDGRFTQNRIEDELATFQAKQEANRILGARGGLANGKRNAKPIAKRNASETLSEREAKADENQQANDKPSHKPLASTEQESKTLSGKPLGFGDFWKAYPNKKGKTEAAKTWARRKLDKHLPAILADVAARGKSDPDWLRGAIPHGSTYVQQERWQDALAPDALPAASAPAAGNSPAKPETAESKAQAAADFAKYVKELGYAP